MAKEPKTRATFTIDSNVLRDMEKFCSSIKMSKSAYLEHLIKDSLVTTVQLFSSNETLAEALVILSNQMNEIKELMSSPEYLSKNKKFNEVKNGIQSVHIHTDKTGEQ
jgi:hypothetical protein